MNVLEFNARGVLIENPMPDRIYTHFIDAANWQRLAVRMLDVQTYAIRAESAGTLPPAIDITEALDAPTVLRGSPLEITGRQMHRLLAHYTLKG